jgi:hypothetical protein
MPDTWERARCGVESTLFSEMSVRGQLGMCTNCLWSGHKSDQVWRHQRLPSRMVGYGLCVE